MQKHISLILAASSLLVLGVLYMSKSTPRNVRNNNPLNIRISSDNWVGSSGDDGEFVKFETPEYGFRAAYKTLLTYRAKHGLDTVEGIINRWAPVEDDNHTENYIDFVHSRLGTSRSLIFDDEIPLDKYPQLILAMADFEGAKGAYSIEQVKQGIALA